ncbi:DNA cytosine methyltransferase [Acetonema longum]|uniref:Cytosine-specific methyltransferase n=1 Tax=Acetonema longum DSM 6540 TaxID=1009370 RepID=F7NJH0_9FIRM|nr:DNA cytosine methyltransferase [Acetonema longum]EGO63800.1 BsaWI methylase [Acetonema longum DSM 6540]
MTNLVCIDIFAGAGGLALGFHKANIMGLFAIEKDPMAFETLSANFLEDNAPYHNFSQWPEWLQKKSFDINEILGNLVLRRHLLDLQGKIDIVCGGPPCQGFSVGGMRDGNDSRNNLPIKYLEFVSLVKPRVIIFENVDGMARPFLSKPSSFKGAFLDWLVNKLGELGYVAAYKIIDASKFGVPQIRKRLIIFGVQKELLDGSKTVSEFFDLMEELRPEFLKEKGLSLEHPVTVFEALEDLNNANRIPCPDSSKFLSTTYKTPQSVFSALMRTGIPDLTVPDSHRFSFHGNKTIEFYKMVHEKQMYGRLPKSVLIEYGTKKDKKVLLDPGMPASTITTHPDEFVHYSEPRIITVREMARLQSFPDNFVFRGRYTINGPRRRFDVARCSQVGNAVPPMLAEAIGRTVKKYLNLLSR